MHSQANFFSSKQTDKTDDAKEILHNLKILGVSDHSTNRILTTIEKMPNSDHIKGAVKFLTQLTHKKSVREHHYKYSSYLAEYFCTISNVGLFAVGYYYEDYTTLFAATFSALSHAIPLQRLHDLDIAGVFAIFSKAAANWKILIEKPGIMLYGASALTLNLLDTKITRKYLDKIGPTLHVIWHLAAALALYKFNQAKSEITPEELQSISSTACLNKIPDFLQDAYQTITDSFYPMSAKNSCTIL